MYKFHFYKGLGSYFVFVLYFSCLLSFTHLLVLLITPHFPREGLPLHGEFGDFFWNGGHEARRRPLCRLLTRCRNCWTPWWPAPGWPLGLGDDSGQEPPEKGGPGLGQENSRNKICILGLSSLSSWKPRATPGLKRESIPSTAL